MTRNYLEKFENKILLKEGSIWEFIKGIIIGKTDFYDIADDDLESKNELRRSVAQLEKWGKSKYPYGSGTWAEHLKKEADKTREWYRSKN